MSTFFRPFRAVTGDVSEINRLIDLLSSAFDAVARAIPSATATKPPTFTIGNAQQVAITNAPPLTTCWVTTSPDGPLDSGVSIEVFSGTTVEAGTGFVMVAPKNGQVVLYLSRGSGSDPTIVHADFTADVRKVAF